MRNVVGNWFSLLGVLVKCRIVGPELIYDLTGITIIWGWNRFKDIYVKQRGLYNVLERYRNRESLYYEMKRIAESRGYSTKSSKTLQRYTEEMRRRVRAEGAGYAFSSRRECANCYKVRTTL